MVGIYHLCKKFETTGSTENKRMRDRKPKTSIREDYEWVMIDEDLQKFSESRVMRTITIGRLPIRNLPKNVKGCGDDQVAAHHRWQQYHWHLLTSNTSTATLQRYSNRVYGIRQANLRASEEPVQTRQRLQQRLQQRSTARQQTCGHLKNLVQPLAASTATLATVYGIRARTYGYLKNLSNSAASIAKRLGRETYGRLRTTCELNSHRQSTAQKLSSSEGAIQTYSVCSNNALGKKSKIIWLTP
ncbi:hypothetical protein AVEN_173827-1 [Araneus ventricosus]|uniref:Uncharacterized protein n=1 Tax=Araneus ventricosus TaxID=182803 RepID=A0A4Y2QZA5_ARAVE|nr:hypothetical protein AVEN_173827-1 [Araneus ventricosus]